MDGLEASSNSRIPQRDLRLLALPLRLRRRTGCERKESEEGGNQFLRLPPERTFEKEMGE